MEKELKGGSQEKKGLLKKSFCDLINDLFNFNT